MLSGVCLIGSVIGSSLLAAAAPEAKFSFDSWQVEGDLEQSAITDVIQTGDGYLWVATYTGLLRFDGVKVKVFDSGAITGLQNGRITSLFEDEAGVLWIGHETGGLTRLSGGEFHSMNIETAQPGGAIETITTDERGDLWLLNDTGRLLRLRDRRSLEAPGGGSASRKASSTREPGGRRGLTANGPGERPIGGACAPLT